ncbi:MAG TPA: alpha/beta hydrolase [Candidatus Dormibacteraeota bacterium]
MATAADGTRLHYLVQGGGPPIVLVGGKTSNIAGAWWRYIPELAKRHTVIALDNRGAGLSDKPDAPYTTELMARDALTVLDAAGEDSAHWFGISLGGMILQRVAIDRPAAVRSLILGATWCKRQPLQPAVIDPALDGNPLRRYAGLYHPRFIAEHGDWVAEDARHFGSLPLHAIVRQDQAGNQHDLCDRLQEIRQPVLILHGRQDRTVPLASAEEMRRRLPDARLEILDPAGHQFHSEQFTSVLRLVLEFIDQVEARRRASAPSRG